MSLEEDAVSDAQARTRPWPAWVIFLAGAVVAFLISSAYVLSAMLFAQRPLTMVSAAAPADTAILSLAPSVTLTLVRVPAGVFTMGSVLSDTEAGDDEKPPGKVYVGEFWIGKYEVTNAQYAVFVQATGRKWTMPSGEENYPVTSISWFDAVAFCQWASQVTGRRVQLPTEAQWEKAARGTDGRLFPWGNDDPDATRLNYDLYVKRTTPVGRYSPRGDSPYGAADMVGNVWEWTSSLYLPYPYRANDGRKDPLSGAMRTLRGGSFVSQRPYARVVARGDSYPDGVGSVLGFRVSMVSEEAGASPGGR